MKVIINEEGFIPGLGRGPFKTPFELDSNQVFNLRQLGYLVIDVKESPDRIKLDPSHLPEKEFQPEEEESDEELDTEEETESSEDQEEESDEELDTEEETESSEDQEEESDETTDEEDESQEESEDEEFDELVKEIGKESTVPELKKLLDDAGIEYKYNTRKDELLEKVEQNKDKL